MARIDTQSDESVAVSEGKGCIKLLIFVPGQKDPEKQIELELNYDQARELILEIKKEINKSVLSI